MGEAREAEGREMEAKEWRDCVEVQSQEEKMGQEVGGQCRGRRWT
jgi:hypothetical protein